MKSYAIAATLAALTLFSDNGTGSHAQEFKGPTEFNVAILTEHNVSFILPSAIIVDDRGRVSGITLTITNHAKKDQGFAIDKFRIKEILKPGETKTIKL